MQKTLRIPRGGDVAVEVDKPTRTAGRAAAPAMTRRGFTALIAVAFTQSWTGRSFAGDSTDWPVSRIVPVKHYPQFEEATDEVLPAEGYLSKIALRDSIPRLVREGVLNRDKMLGLQQAKPFRDELSAMLDGPSDDPIFLTRDNASDYVNLLWPIGLSNHMDGNAQSPLFTPRLPTFASTSGWSLGDQDQGSVYFNKFTIVALTAIQEATAITVANSTFRPCCDNATFYQDCNHGSALLGVLQLGAAQGLSEAELYREALAFNAFWFPDYYVRTALYFEVVRKQAWPDVDPKLIMSKAYSSLSGWQQNVQLPLQAIPDLIPQPRGGANCGVGGPVLYRRQ